MEAATLFAVCAAQGVRAGCLLAVSDVLTAGRERIDHEGLVAAGERLGQVAVNALALYPRDRSADAGGRP
jgi:uridine phosphorylase